MDEQREDDQLEPTHSSSVPVQDVPLKTYWKQWTIEKGGEKGSGISMLMVRRDDDDDIKLHLIMEFLILKSGVCDSPFIFITPRSTLNLSHSTH